MRFQALTPVVFSLWFTISQAAPAIGTKPLLGPGQTKAQLRQITGRFVGRTTTGVASFCSGILVSERLVLTANHCLDFMAGHESLVSFNLPENDDPAVSSAAYRIAGVAHNPKYRERGLPSDSDNDFAVVKLDRPIVKQNLPSYYAGAVQEGQRIVYRGTNGSAAGVGAIVQHEGFIGFEDGKGAVHALIPSLVGGNSGGPIFYNDLQTNRYYLMGVASAVSDDSNEVLFTRFYPSRMADLKPQTTIGQRLKSDATWLYGMISKALR